MSKHPDDMFFPFSKDEPLRTSYTIYDLHGLALPRHGSPPTINSFDPEVELKKVQKIQNILKKKSHIIIMK